MSFRVFKENTITDGERSVSTLNDAVAVYSEYFTAGYAVRVIEVETGMEYMMSEQKLVPVSSFSGVAHAATAPGPRVRKGASKGKSASA